MWPSKIRPGSLPSLNALAMLVLTLARPTNGTAVTISRRPRWSSSRRAVPRCTMRPRPFIRYSRMPSSPTIVPPLGKSGPLTYCMSSSTVMSRSVEQGDAGVQHLAQVVGRHARGEPETDAVLAVDRRRNARRQVVRLDDLRVLLVRRHQRHGVLADVAQHDLAHAATGASPCSASPPPGRRRPSRSCPGRRSAGSAAKSPGPAARQRRRSPPGHAGAPAPSPSRPPRPTSPCRATHPSPCGT